MGKSAMTSIRMPDEGVRSCGMKPKGSGWTNSRAKGSPLTGKDDPGAQSSASVDAWTDALRC
jgi:hypothetical protein